MKTNTGDAWDEQDKMGLDFHDEEEVIDSRGAEGP